MNKSLALIQVVVFLTTTFFHFPISSNSFYPLTKKENENCLKIMAYNIHHANPPSKPDIIDIDAIVKTIKAKDPDIVALQEIDANTTRSGEGNQAEIIAEKLDMNFFFAKAIDYEGGEYGVAVLSKYPISEEKIHRLPTAAETNGEPRVLATVKVSLPDGTFIRFGSTHMDAQKEHINRLLQIEEIITIAGEESLPMIVAGDFNAPPGSEVINRMDEAFTRTCTNCAPTIPVHNPTKAIDFIAYKPANHFSVVNHEVINETYASDHLPIFAVLKIKKQ